MRVRPGGPLVTMAVTMCGACGQSFHPRGRGRFCSHACRQAAFRGRRRAVQTTQARHQPQLAVVYECSSCETRSVGRQRCDECDLFTKRVGLGGTCPHCDEPVAVSDLAT